MKLEFYRQFFFEQHSYTKFNENPSSGSRVVPCGRTDMAKLTSAFRNFEKAPNKTRQSQIYFNNVLLLSMRHVSTLITMRHQAQTHVNTDR